MPITTYALDLLATNPANRIVNELRDFTTPNSKLFVPAGGPFFSSLGLVVKDKVTGATLLPVQDYKALQFYKEASMASSKEVCCFIQVIKPGVTGVYLTYRVIGGQFSQLSQALQDFIANTPIGAIGNPTWGGILDKPATYPPSAHFHYPNEWRGYTEVIILLEQIRQAIAVGDRPTIAAIYTYIDENLGDLVEAYLAVHPTIVNTPLDDTSYLIGNGTLATPLNLDVVKADGRYQRTNNTDLTQIGGINDFGLAVSGSYFNISAPTSRWVSGCAYIEPNGDLVGLTPATNGSQVRMMYWRWSGYSALTPVTSAKATDVVYRPPGLAPEESIQSCGSTTETAMVVQIWETVAGVDQYKEHAVIILNGSLRADYHQIVRLGNALENEAAIVNPVKVTQATPSAVVIGDTIYVIAATNAIEVVCISVPVAGGAYTREIGWVTQGLWTTTSAIDTIRPFANLYTRDTAGTPDAFFNLVNPDFTDPISWTPANAISGTNAQFCQTGNKVRIRWSYYGQFTLVPGVGSTSNVSIVPTFGMDINFDTKQVTVPIRYRNHRVNLDSHAVSGNQVIDVDYNEFLYVNNYNPAGSSSPFSQVLTDGTIIYNYNVQPSGGSNFNLIKRMSPRTTAFDVAFNYNWQTAAAAYTILLPAFASPPLNLPPPTLVIPSMISYFTASNKLMMIPLGSTTSGRTTPIQQVLVTLTGASDAASYNDLAGNVFDGYALNNDRVAGRLAIPTPVTSSLDSTGVKYGSLFFSNSPNTTYGASTLNDDGSLVTGTTVTLSAAMNASITTFVNGALVGDTRAWNMTLFPHEPTNGFITMSRHVVSTQTVYSDVHPISVTMDGGLNITGFTVDMGVTLNTRTVLTGFALSLDNVTHLNLGTGFAAQYSTDVTTDDTLTVLYRSATHGAIGSPTGSIYDANIRCYQRDKDGVWSIKGTLAVGVLPITPAVHPTLGLGVIDSSYAGRAMTVFKSFATTALTSPTLTLLTSPRPAFGFYLNITTPIPVYMGGISTELPNQVITLTDFVTSPASKTLYCYIKLLSGQATFFVSETTIAETAYQTYIGKLVTDSTSIISSDFAPVTRFGIYRAATSTRGASLVVSTGRPDQTTAVDYWGRFPGVSLSPGNLISLNSDGVYYGITAPANVANVYVDSSSGGSDVTGDGTRAFPWKTIQYALAQGPVGINRTLWLHEHQTHLITTGDPAILRGGYCYIGPYGDDTDALPVIPGDNDWACPAGIGLGVVIRSVPSTYMDGDGVTEYKLGQCMWPNGNGRFSSDAISYTVGATASTGFDSTYMSMIGSPHEPGDFQLRWGNVNFIDSDGELFPKGGALTIGLAKVNFTGTGAIVKRGSKGMSVFINQCSIGGVDKTDSEIGAAYFKEQFNSYVSYSNISTNASPVPITQIGKMQNFGYTMAGSYGTTVRQTQTLTALPVDGLLIIHSSNNVAQGFTSGGGITLTIEVNTVAHASDTVLGSQSQHAIIAIPAGVSPVINILTGNDNTSVTSSVTTLTTYEFKPRV